MEAQLAVYVDLENFIGFCLNLGLPIDLGPVLARLKEHGRIVIRRSFGDLYKIPLSSEQKQDIRRMLQKNLIQHEDVPYHNSVKNSSDMRLTIEALYTVIMNPSLDTIALVAADKDYIPLFMKLREIGKEIVCISGSRDTTSEMSIHSCDYVYYHENLVSTEDCDISIDPRRVLIDALSSLSSAGLSSVSSSQLLQRMRRLHPDVDFHPYRNFKHLCDEALSDGLLTSDHEGMLSLPSGDVSSSEKISEPLSEIDIREWILRKLRVNLPEARLREKVFSSVCGIDLSQSPSLDEISDVLCSNINEPRLSKSMCFKLLYSILRSNAFLCSKGDSTSNPKILQLRKMFSAHELERKFAENLIRQFIRETSGQFDPVIWSRVLYHTDSEAASLELLAESLS